MMLRWIINKGDKMYISKATKQNDQIKLIKFALKYSGLHTFAQDKRTVEVVCATHNLGIIKVNEFNQFQLKSTLLANDFLSARG